MKLDMRQTVMESCVLDGHGYCIKRGVEHERVKAKAVLRTELGRYKTEREMGPQIEKVKNRQCN